MSNTDNGSIFYKDEYMTVVFPPLYLRAREIAEKMYKKDKTTRLLIASNEPLAQPKHCYIDGGKAAVRSLCSCGVPGYSNIACRCSDADKQRHTDILKEELDQGSYVYIDLKFRLEDISLSNYMTKDAKAILIKCLLNFPCLNLKRVVDILKIAVVIAEDLGNKQLEDCDIAEAVTLSGACKLKLSRNFTENDV